MLFIWFFSFFYESTLLLFLSLANPKTKIIIANNTRKFQTVILKFSHELYCCCFMKVTAIYSIYIYRTMFKWISKVSNITNFLLLHSISWRYQVLKNLRSATCRYTIKMSNKLFPAGCYIQAESQIEKPHGKNPLIKSQNVRYPIIKTSNGFISYNWCMYFQLKFDDITLKSKSRKLKICQTYKITHTFA